MKKILLQKGRDEVCASLRATPQPTRDPAPPLTTSPHDEQHQHPRMPPPSIEHSQIADRSSSSSRVSTPSSDLPHHHHHPPPPPPSDFPALLPAVTSLPVSSLPLLMLPLPARTGVGASTLDKFYLGESNRAGGAFSLPPPPHAYPGFFQLGGDGRFPGVVPSSRLLQFGKPTDAEVADFQVLREESLYGRLGNALAVPLRSAETVARMRKSAELRFDEGREYGRASLSGMVTVETMRRDVVAMETMRREVAMETMRRDVVAMETMRRDAVAMEMVTSSNIVEAKSGDSVMEVDVEEDEDDRGLMRSRSIGRSCEDLVEEDLPRMMIEKREMSPMERTDNTLDDSKTAASPRSDLHESFKSPASSGHHPKSVYRPKGRPTKASTAAASAATGGAGGGGGVDVGGGGGGGPGGVRSIIRCPVCAKQFNNSSALAKHKLTHSDERKYACTLCNKAFKRQDHLNGHMMTHSSMKPFACKFIGCNKSYCDARSLRRHMENHHQECSSNSSTTTTGGGGSAAGFFNYDGSSYQPGYGAEGGGGASDGSLSYLQQVSPISPVGGGLRGATSVGSVASRQFGVGGGGMVPQGQMWVTGYNPLDEPKPVKCHVCGRGFKNIPALNGHMRLHGGYVRKDPENLDESQDVSRSSDARTESRFSQSENSLSSASVNDRQHESYPDRPSFATTSLLKGMETGGRRHFFLGSTNAEVEVGRGGPEKLVAVEREEVRGHAAEMRSCVEEARSRAEEMTRSRVEDMRSRAEEMMRSRAEDTRSQAEETRSRTEDTRSRAEETKSRAEELMRSRAEDTRSRAEEMMRSRAEEPRSRAEEMKIHAEEFREHALYARFGLLDRCVGTARTVGGSSGEFRVRESTPLDASREFEGAHGPRRYGGDSDQPAGVKCPSPRKGTRQEDDFPKDFTVRSRLLEEDRPPIVQMMRLAGHQISSGVDKLLGYTAEYSNAFECDKAKTEIRRQFGPITTGGASYVNQPSSPGKPPRRVRGAEEAGMPPLVAVSQAKPTAAVETISAKAGGAEFASAVGGPPRHSKAGSRCTETILQRRGGKTREEKLLVSSGDREECVPDSTSGRDDVGAAAERKMWNVKSEDNRKFSTGTPPHTDVTYVESDIPKGEECDVRRLAGESAPEGFLNAKNSPPRTVTSPSTRQSACLYRQRWMNLQLKQSGGQPCPEIPGDSHGSGGQRCPEIPGDSHGSVCGGASTYGTGTDCGDPSTPKPNHKKETGAHPLSEPSRHVRNAAAEPGSCLSTGNNPTGFPPHHRSSPTSPAFQASSPLTWKRGGGNNLPTLSYPTTIDVGSATLQSCHSGFTPREGLHHVHSNSCLTHTAADPNSYVQSHIPCSPYDPRPHTPCAAHTPFTPCQPYTPHTPYTPCAANRQSTPKHASHFEFPPRVCLQESSQCDSPYPGSSQAAQLGPGQAVEIRLVVEPEYHPLEKYNMEAELLRQHGYVDRRDSIGTTDFEMDRPRKHLQTTESDSRLNLLWQRDFDRQKQQLHNTGTGHARLQNEPGNPDDGFSASLPTGAKRNSPGLAYNSSTVEKTEKKSEKTERKRKLSEDSPVSVETKRSATLMENRNSTETTGRDSRDVEPVSSSCGAPFKTDEEIERRKVEEEMEVDPLKPCKESYPGETVFRNPPSPLKVKKSRPRPEPLFIPPNVNHFGFQSRLRSPRLWDGLAKQMAPPYTPPPMLSPARSGSGLFWKLHSGFHSPVTGPPVLPKYDKVKCPILSWPEETPPPTADERQPPETDLQPHINIGPQYQPDLPHFRGSKPRGQERTSYDERSTLVWTPSTAAKLNEEEVTQYLQYACCAIIPGNGSNQEYAMHLLHLSRGDMKKAVKLLLESEPRLPRSSGLKTYKYQDCVKWKRTEIDLFHKSIMKLDKDFFQISKLVGSKSVKDCVQFYYLWKKICPDELKQLKILRRKREQYELYNRRSKDLRSSSGGGSQTQKSGHEKSNNVSKGSKKHEQMEPLDFQYQDSTGKPVLLKEETMEDSDAEKRWCSICKRSFTSVRNFSAHVKMHERSRMRREQTELDGGGGGGAKQLPYSKQMGSNSGF